MSVVDMIWLCDPGGNATGKGPSPNCPCNACKQAIASARRVQASWREFCASHPHEDPSTIAHQVLAADDHRKQHAVLEQSTAGPAIGDVVWFYFRHAHGIAEGTDIERIEVFTGISEMRCRPATVVGVSRDDGRVVLPGALRVEILGECEMGLDLDVDFDPSDRIEMPGGVVLPPGRHQPMVPAHDGLEVGKLGRSWPQNRRWADRPHPSMKVTAAA